MVSNARGNRHSDGVNPVSETVFDCAPAVVFLIKLQLILFQFLLKWCDSNLRLSQQSRNGTLLRRVCLGGRSRGIWLQQMQAAQQEKLVYRMIIIEYRNLRNAGNQGINGELMVDH